MGKGENAGNQHFLLFPHCYLSIQKEFLFSSCIYLVVCKCFQFGAVQKIVIGQRVKVDQSNILLFDKKLKTLESKTENVHRMVVKHRPFFCFFFPVKDKYGDAGEDDSDSSSDLDSEDDEMVSHSLYD